MAVNASQWTDVPRRPEQPALVLCKTCLKLHTIDWERDWRARMDRFVSEHYAQHGRHEFTIVVQ